MQRYSHPDPLTEVGTEASELAARALVVSTDPLVRDGFVTRLDTAAAGEADTDDDVPAAVARIDANVVLWDLGPTDDVDVDASFDGLDVPVIALSAPGVRAVDVLARGASAVLLRNASSDTLRSAVDTVLHGLTVVEPSLLAPELERASSDRAAASAKENDGSIEALTPREREVLELMASGLSNKLIADQLGISTHTAKFHIGAILAKMDASTRTEAVVRAVQHGLVLV